MENLTELRAKLARLLKVYNSAPPEKRPEALRRTFWELEKERQAKQDHVLPFLPHIKN